MALNQQSDSIEVGGRLAKIWRELVGALDVVCFTVPGASML